VFRLATHNPVSLSLTRKEDMKHIRAYCMITTVFALTVGCQTVTNKVDNQRFSRHDQIYYFQHRLIPTWVHQSNGKFFSDLKSGIPSQLLNAATEIVDKEFASSLILKPFPEREAYALVFQRPAEITECYFSVIQKAKEGYRYYTLEKSIDFTGEGIKSVVGSWSKDGQHENLGPRTYDDLDSFLEDVL